MWDNAFLLRRIANALFVFSVLALLYVAVHYIVHQPKLLPIQTVRLSSTPDRVMPAEVLAMVQRSVQGNFLTVNIDSLRQSLETIPWVRNVNVRREFPDRLVVEIEEHKPLAHWNDEALVNQQGEVFLAETTEKLPRFIGVEGSSAEVSKAYAELSNQLAVLNLHVTQLALSARHAWQLHLSDGTVVELGREALQERLARFVAYQKTEDSRLKAEETAQKAEDGKKKTEETAQKAGDRMGRGVVVDMRYRNGFAVRQVVKKQGAQG